MNFLDAEIDLTSDLSGVAAPRWARKQQASPKKSSTSADRFISSRKHMDMDINQYKLFAKENCENLSEEGAYQSSLENRMFDGKKISQSKILHLAEAAPSAPKTYQNNLRVLYSSNKIGGGASATAKKSTRYIPQTAERILDAPGLIDDFYLNLLDWSSQNTLAVALGNVVYLWNAETGSIQKLMETSSQENYITSLSWIEDGSYIGIGTNFNSTLIYDVERNKQVRSMDGHTARVSALSWNKHILSSGGRDKLIINHDVRIRDHKIATLVGHEQEVCGLKWNFEGTQLASGGNDNILNIWDATAADGDKPKFSITAHCAAVKALAWCPWQSNLLASGGGTADRKLMFWNTNTGAMLNSIDTKSQVCSIMFSKNDRELITSHGFSQNQLTVWKYPSLVKVAELTGHTSRVLHLAQSPDGATVVSAAGDETLRFWRVFSSANDVARSSSEGKGFQSQLAMKTMNIR